jgi:hypothetical protein
MLTDPSVDVTFEPIIALLAKCANSHLQAKPVGRDFKAVLLLFDEGRTGSMLADISERCNTIEEYGTDMELSL